MQAGSQAVQQAIPVNCHHDIPICHKQLFTLRTQYATYRQDMRRNKELRRNTVMLKMSSTLKWRITKQETTHADKRINQPNKTDGLQCTTPSTAQHLYRARVFSIGMWIAISQADNWQIDRIWWTNSTSTCLREFWTLTPPAWQPMQCTWSRCNHWLKSSSPFYKNTEWNRQHVIHPVSARSFEYMYCTDTEWTWSAFDQAYREPVWNKLGAVRHTHWVD